MEAKRTDEIKNLPMVFVPSRSRLMVQESVARGHRFAYLLISSHLISLLSVSHLHPVFFFFCCVCGGNGDGRLES